jgi:hypothetical protein
MAIMNCARFDQYGTPRVAGMDSTTTTETLQSLLSDTDQKLIMVMWIVSMAMKVALMLSIPVSLSRQKLSQSFSPADVPLQNCGSG